MILTCSRWLRGASVATLIVTLTCVTVRPARAADENDKTPAGATSEGADKTATPPTAVQQIETDEEGPSTRVAKKVRHGLVPQPAPTDADEKPFWKSWVFWSVTGVLVAGAVGAVVYSTSGTKGSVGPCPAGVALSLGCYGAGRN